MEPILRRKSLATVILVAVALFCLIPAASSLDCDVCLRAGDKGSQTCERVPCNTREDVLAAAKVTDRSLGSVTGDGDKETAVQDVLRAELALGGDLTGTGKTNCVKILATLISVLEDHRTVEAPYLHAMCNYVEPTAPPQDKPYFNYPGLGGDSDRGRHVIVESVHVCDDETGTQAHCRVSTSELHRSGSSKGLKGPGYLSAALATVLAFLGASN